jgi:hypothetical protein
MSEDQEPWEHEGDWSRLKGSDKAPQLEFAEGDISKGD